MEQVYQGLDFQECFITTRNGLKIPFRVERLDINPNHFPEMTGYLIGSPSKFLHRKPTEIKNVIFNDPATIVIWNDGSKTVVKCQEGDTYDKEKGLALCISKKFLGNHGNFNEVFKKWIKTEEA